MKRIIAILPLLIGCQAEEPADGPTCDEAAACESDATDAMAACGSADGPCLDAAADPQPCAHSLCLASCRLQAAQDGETCASGAPDACASSQTSCLGACYAASVDCFESQDACTDFESCITAQGDCVAECNG